MMPSRREVLFGTDEIPAPPLALGAGALSFDLVDGSIRRLAWNGVEIVRGIAFLIRDEAWGTAGAVLGEPQVVRREGGLDVAWTGEIRVGASRFSLSATLSATADGTFSFAVEGVPDRDIRTNRAGFVLLHPAHFAGLPVTQLKVDGTEAPGAFPAPISAGQPFLDLKGLRYVLPGAGEVTCRMTAVLPGDPDGRFETEDQRNWGDASFKTYVGSLLDPWPYTLPAGQPFRQSVAVSVTPHPAATAGPPAAAEAAPAARRLPAFGIGVPHGAHRMAPPAKAALLALGLPWWVVEGDLRRADLASHLAAVAALAARAPRRPRIQLEAVLPATRDPGAELAAAAEACRGAGLVPEAVLPCPAPYLRSYQPSGPWPDLAPLEDWTAAARAAFPSARIGGGMLTNFTELNRKRPPGGIDFVSHTWTSIVHAADDVSVMETLETLPHIARSIRALCPGVASRLGPASIAMRSNPYGAVLPENPGWTRMPLSDRDPRQRGLYGAAWTVGFAAALATEGLEILALHAVDGFLGVTEGAALRPCYHVLAALGAVSGKENVFLAMPSGWAGLAWRNGDGTVGVIAGNMTGEPVPCPWQGEGLVLDALSSPAAALSPGWGQGPAAPLPPRLDAYAVALIPRLSGAAPGSERRH